MNLQDLYVAGVLREGDESGRSVDEKIIQKPWEARLDEVGEVVGAGSPIRESLFRHLSGVVLWVRTALGPCELWVRGRFSSTLLELDPDREELDLVLLYDHRTDVRSEGVAWVLQILQAGPIELFPGRLKMVALQASHPDFRFDRDQEAIRSRVRTADPSAGDNLVTGWLTIVDVQGTDQ